MFDVSYIDTIGNAYFNNASHVCIDGYYGRNGTVCLRKTSGLGLGYTVLAASAAILLVLVLVAVKKRWFNMILKSPLVEPDESIFLIDVEAEGLPDPPHIQNPISRL